MSPVRPQWDKIPVGRPTTGILAQLLKGRLSTVKACVDQLRGVSRRPRFVPIERLEDKYRTFDLQAQHQYLEIGADASRPATRLHTGLLVHYSAVREINVSYSILSFLYYSFRVNNKLTSIDETPATVLRKRHA